MTNETKPHCEGTLEDRLFSGIDDCVAAAFAELQTSIAGDATQPTYDALDEAIGTLSTLSQPPKDTKPKSR